VESLKQKANTTFIFYNLQMKKAQSLRKINDHNGQHGYYNANFVERAQFFFEYKYPDKSAHYNYTDVH
jgi:hypothetical protein